MTGWANNEQKRIMIEFMRTHLQLAKDVVSPTFTRKQRADQWAELAHHLNACGPARPKESWRVTWKRFSTTNPFYRQMLTPEEKEIPVRRTYSITKRNPPRTSSRQNSINRERGEDASVQEQSVSEGNAHQYLNGRKPSNEHTFPVNVPQDIKAECTVRSTPQCSPEVEESAEVSSPQQEKIVYSTPQSSPEVEESAEVSSPQQKKSVCSTPQCSPEVEESAEVSSPQQKKSVCSTPQCSPEVEESAEVSSPQPKKSGKITTLDCLKSITENVVKTQQSMTEAVWALVRVQEKRAKAEESMAESGKKFIVLMENWLQKQ